MNTFDGYIRRDGTNSKVLLDGGDAKALSSFIGTLSYNNNKITYTKADGTSYDLVDLSNYIYNLRAATSDNLGGIRIGFSQSGKNYPIQLDSNNKAYVYVPWEENSHYTTRLYVGDGTAENKVTTNGNTRITVTDNNNVRNYITLIGSGATNISSDDNGKITINSTNTTYNTGDSATLNKGTNTEGKLWSAKTLVDYISDILGVDSTAITSLNTLIGLLHDNDTATGILVELAKKLNTPSSSIGSNNQPIYWNGNSFTTIGYTIEKSVPSNAIFTDTKYSFYVGENNNIKEHKNVSNPYFKLFENNTPTSIQIKAGTGISVNSDDSGNITITNSSPDQNHNTDKTGIKLGTISGTKKTDSTVIINNSSTGLTIAGGTNKFSIGDGTNYIEIPITPSFTVTNKDSTIGTSLTTIATISGTDIKAKIDSYLPLSGGILTGALTVKHYIFGYNYLHAGSNAPAFVFDKPGINYTGIGANGEVDTIYFSAATVSNNEAAWVTSYKQKWKFNGTIYQEDNAIIHSGNIGSQNVNYATSSGNADTVDGYHYNDLPYLPISGGTLTGNISFSGDNNITWSRNTDSAKIHFKNTGDSDSDSYLGFLTSDNGNEYFKFGHTSGNAYTEWMSIKSDGVRVKGTKVSLEGHTHSYLSTTTKYAAGNSVGGSANYLRWESAESSSYARKIPISWADDVETTTTRFRATYSNSLTYRTDTNTISSNISGKAASADSADKIKSRGNLVYYEEGSTTTGESGVNLYKVYNNGYPVTYGNLLHINGSGAGQILVEWCNSSKLGHLYYRSKRDNSYNGWSAWGKVAFTTDNVASASKWATSRKITLTGSVTGSVSIDGSGDVTLATTTNHTHNYLPLSGGTMVGTVSAANDAYGGGGFHNGYANIILRGNITTGTSGIVFSSSKGDTAINSPSDCAFIQYQPYGVSAATAVGTNPTIGTSGESGRFVIGIHNDSGDQLWLQTSTINNLKHVVGANVYTIYDSGNLPAYPTKESWNYDDRYLKLSGGTMSGNLLVSNDENSEPYIGVKQEGYGDIFLISGKNSKNRGLYNSDAGLGWLCGWDANNNAFFNGNATSATTASNATNATYANCLNLVAGNEIRFNKIPSSSTNIFFNYVWDGGIADDKINNYCFLNGNRGYAGIVAEQLSCKNGYIYLYGPGSDTYNLSSIFSNSSGLTIETPRATNALNGTVLPLMVKTRGGQWSELQTGTIVANGNVTATAFYASSDLRLKNILTHPNYSAEQLASLPLVKYTWKDKENDSVHLGSIAQNVEEDFAELVNTDNKGYKSLDYATLGTIGVISLAREIVELKKEIKELKSKLYGN